MIDKNNKKTKIQNRIVVHAEINGIKYFSTNNIGLAGALIVKGQAQIREQEIMRTVRAFLFLDNQEAQIIIAAYLNNSLLVDARTYYRQIKNFENGSFHKSPKVISNKQRKNNTKGATKIGVADLTLAAALVANGHLLEEIKQSEDGKPIFKISSKSKKKNNIFFQVLPTLYEQYDLSVSVKEFMRELQNLGTRLIRTAHPSAPKKEEL